MQRAIVPFVNPYKLSLQGLARRYPRLPAGIMAKTARLAWTHRARLRPAVKTIQRKFRLRQAKAKFKLVPNGGGNTEAIELVSLTPVSYSGLNYITPQMPVTGTNTDQRADQHIKLSGIRYCFLFTHQGIGPTNDTLYTRYPIYEVHVALIQMKGNPTNGGAWNFPEIQQQVTRYFFRQQKGDGNNIDSDQRSTPFEPYLNTGQWSFNRSCLPLCTDKFNIMFHKKFLLYPRYATGAAEGNKIHFRRVEGYFNAKRKQFDFYNSQDLYGKHPFQFVCWLNAQTPEDHFQIPPNQINTITPVNWHARTKVYYR